MISGNIQDIPLKGLTSTLSDYDCQDGDLMVCHNLVNNGAGLQPVEEPAILTDKDGTTTLPELPDNSQLVFTHKTSKQTVYIIHTDNEDATENRFMFAVMGGGTWTNVTDEVTEGELSAVGNVLIIANSDSGLNYCKWDLETTSYKYLGTSFPDINMRFSSAVLSTEDTITLEGLTSDDVFLFNRAKNRGLFQTPISTSVSGDYDTAYDRIEACWEQGLMNDSIFAAYNYVVNEMFKQGYFLSPFLVRFAYKLYDGNYTMQSTPVLIVPSNNEFDITFTHSPSNYPITAESDEKLDSAGYRAECMFSPAKLKYSVSGLDKLEDWKDIVEEICVFASLPISKYLNTGNLGHTWLSKNQGDDYEKNWVKTVKFQRPGSGTVTECNLSCICYACQVTLPTRAGEAKDWVESAGQNMYLLKSFSIDALKADTLGYLKPKNNYDVSMLGTSESLTDGYRVRAIYKPQFLTAYNNRLNLANLSITERSSFPDGFMGDVHANSDGTGIINTAYVYICEDGVWSRVSCNLTIWCDPAYRVGFFYYPNPDAKYLYIEDVGYIKLTLHPFLNGAYYFNPNLFGYEATTTTPSEIPTTLTGVGTVEHPNWVITSEVDNPFIFPAIGVNAVGSGDILGLTSATKAMSEGTAFGSHPLYVFTTEGIYPMAVGDTGIFVAVSQPVSREVPYSKNAILQIDNSVIFLCERGLMQLNGGQTTLLSGDLQSRFTTIEAGLDLEKWTDLHKAFFGDGGHTYLEAYQFLPYIKSASLAFDYANYRIYVYNPSHASGAAYVYNIGTKTWSTVDCTMQSSVVGYPSTLINLIRDGKMIIAKFTQGSVDSTTELVNDGEGFYITRPMKFKLNDILKTVRRVIERGVIKPANDKIVALYGSRDYNSYELVSAKKGHHIPRISGTPYEAFIVAGWIKMDPDMNSVSRLSLEVKEKYVDKLR